MLLLAAVCGGVSFGACEAAPRTGPERPFTVDWRVIAAPTADLRAAAFFPGTKNAIVIGDTGTILRSDDGGRNWKLPARPSGFKSSLSALAFTDSLNGVAVGDNGTILRTSDGGQVWDRVALAGVSAHLRAVSFSDAMNGIAVGDAGTILRTQNAGKDWHKANTASSGIGDLRAVTFGKAGCGIVVGTDETILTTTDGGEHWHQSTIIAGQETTRHRIGKLVLSTVLYVSETVVLSAGGGRSGLGFSSGESEQPILRSEDGGETWQRIALPSGIAADVAEVVSSGGMKAFAIGRGSNVWHSDDGMTSSSAGFGS
jgi:photosystem II stability/assembly factor-like uncharacterized protein